MAALASGTNFTAVNGGKFADLLNNYKGKLFLKDALKLTSAEVSLSALPPKGEVPFLHSHKQNEEIYIGISGEGQFLVDGQTFPISEGSVVRVSPKGNRCIRNTSASVPLTFICFQAAEGSLNQWVMEDGIISEEKAKWE